MDPNTLYLDADPEICLNMDLNPGFFTQLRYIINFEKMCPGIIFYLLKWKGAIRPGFLQKYFLVNFRARSWLNTAYPFTKKVLS